MNRYHRSCIGLMEQCNDGEWVRYEEYEQLMGAAIEYKRKYEREESYTQELAYTGKRVAILLFLLVAIIAATIVFSWRTPEKPSNQTCTVWKYEVVGDEREAI